MLTVAAGVSLQPYSSDENVAASLLFNRAPTTLATHQSCDAYVIVSNSITLPPVEEFHSKGKEG